MAVGSPPWGVKLNASNQKKGKSRNRRLQRLRLLYLAIEVGVVLDGLLAEVAHLRPARTRHLVAAFFFEELKEEGKLNI